jgi:hypothetical protein
MHASPVLIGTSVYGFKSASRLCRPGLTAGGPTGFGVITSGSTSKCNATRSYIADREPRTGGAVAKG